MKKSTRILAIVMIVFAIGIIGFSVSGTNDLNISAYAAVLKQGSNGSEVKTVQQKLKSWGYYSGSVDGVFGAQTKAAVINFQKKNGLTADGVVGNKTKQALGIPTSGTSTSGNSNYSSSDVYLLAKLIYSEARGESYTGQVAVGAVVLNRVRSSKFPNTISGVIYESYAFTAVADGQINLTPNDTAKKAAEAAMNGWDPSYGAIYYYNPSTATSQWIFSRKTTVIIGRHVFAV